MVSTSATRCSPATWMFFEIWSPPSPNAIGGKFWGWEWLNEITPGGTPDYVSDYVKLCRAGVEAARAVDPSLRSVLAGGLWPRGYRLDVLNAGAGNYINALPIHYGNGTGVRKCAKIWIPLVIKKPPFGRTSHRRSSFNGIALGWISSRRPPNRNG